MSGTPSFPVVLSGPSGVGKGTVVAELRRRYPQVWVSVSATSRSPRPGEIEGVHYRFIGEDAFSALVESGQMLEWAKVHNAYRYGTPRQPVEEALAAGRPTLLEIELQGARQVRRNMPGAVLVFLAPPSWEELTRRLAGRGTEGAEEQRRRLATAEGEMAAEDEFDHVIINDDATRAADELAHIMGITR